MIRKQLYETPETEVVKVAIEQTIMDGSFNVKRQAYSTEEEETWG